MTTLSTGWDMPGPADLHAISRASKLAIQYPGDQQGVQLPVTCKIGGKGPCRVEVRNATAREGRVIWERNCGFALYPIGDGVCEGEMGDPGITSLSPDEGTVSISL